MLRLVLFIFIVVVIAYFMVGKSGPTTVAFYAPDDQMCSIGLYWVSDDRESILLAQDTFPDDIDPNDAGQILWGRVRDSLIPERMAIMEFDFPLKARKML